MLRTQQQRTLHSLKHANSRAHAIGIKHACNVGRLASHTSKLSAISKSDNLYQPTSARGSTHSFEQPGVPLKPTNPVGKALPLSTKDRTVTDLISRPFKRLQFPRAGKDQLSPATLGASPLSTQKNLNYSRLFLPQEESISAPIWDRSKMTSQSSKVRGSQPARSGTAKDRHAGKLRHTTTAMGTKSTEPIVIEDDDDNDNDKAESKRPTNAFSNVNSFQSQGPGRHDRRHPRHESDRHSRSPSTSSISSDMSFWSCDFSDVEDSGHASSLALQQAQNSSIQHVSTTADEYRNRLLAQRLQREEDYSYEMKQTSFFAQLSA